MVKNPTKRNENIKIGVEKGRFTSHPAPSGAASGVKGGEETEIPELLTFFYDFILFNSEL